MEQNSIFLDENDLSLYFQNLPRDFTLVVNSTEYPVNKQVICSFSEIIANKIAALDTSKSQLHIDIDDPHKVFPLVIDFLHGQKIDINSYNDFYLNKIAETLKIQPLKEVIQDSLTEEISVSNIIPRILQNYDNIDPNLLDFLLENIEDVQKDNHIFLFPKEFLLKICQSENAKFKSDSSKYIFKLKCSAHFIEDCNIFMDENEYKYLPIDAIKELLTNEEFAVLDQKIPTFQIVQNLLTKISEDQTKINEIEANIEKAKNELNRLHAESVKQQRDKSQFDETERKLHDKYEAFQKDINQVIKGIQPHLTILETLKITGDQIDEISSRVSMLQGKICDLKKYTQAFHLTNTSMLNIVLDFDKKMGELQQLLSNLTTNENDINYIQQSFQHVLDELNELATM